MKILLRECLCWCMIVVFILSIQSCKSSKEIVYFQNLDIKKIDSITALKVHVIVPGDILQLNVITMNEEADRAFTKSGFKLDNSSQTGYLVDSSGHIDIPYLGLFKIKGYSTSSARDALKEKLAPFLKDPVISIKLMNFTISVMGDVAKPGTFQIMNERVSLPEALSLAGDLTITGKRNNVTIIREKNGTRTYSKIDLKKADLFTSPYYYLESNDIVYVEPSKAKIAQADTRTWQALTFVVTTLSLVTVLILRVK